jgi:hypothetical protein
MQTYTIYHARECITVNLFTMKCSREWCKVNFLGFSPRRNTLSGKLGMDNQQCFVCEKSIALEDCTDTADLGMCATCMTKSYLGKRLPMADAWYECPYICYISVHRQTNALYATAIVRRNGDNRKKSKKIVESCHNQARGEETNNDGVCVIQLP